MKSIAATLHAGFIWYALSQSGDAFGCRGLHDVRGFAVLVSAVSIGAILFGKDGWLLLLIKRKSLEEKARIAALEKD